MDNLFRDQCKGGIGANAKMYHDPSKAKRNIGRVAKENAKPGFLKAPQSVVTARDCPTRDIASWKNGKIGIKTGQAGSRPQQRSHMSNIGCLNAHHGAPQ
jgi:hypothetical protein